MEFRPFSLRLSKWMPLWEMTGEVEVVFRLLLLRSSIKIVTFKRFQEKKKVDFGLFFFTLENPKNRCNRKIEINKILKAEY